MERTCLLVNMHSNLDCWDNKAFTGITWDSGIRFHPGPARYLWRLAVQERRSFVIPINIWGIDLIIGVCAQIFCGFI